MGPDHAQHGAGIGGAVDVGQHGDAVDGLADATGLEDDRRVGAAE